MTLRVEVWSRPGEFPYVRKIASPPYSSAGLTSVFSGVGRGNVVLPRNYDRLDEILYTDPDTPSNGAWSTIRVYDDTTLVYEWLPNPRVPATDKNDPDIELTGLGIESIMGFARVEPWDWDGSTSWVSTFPNWVWGGRNILTNPGFEDSTCRPEVNQVVIDATVSGGTFTLSDGVDTTSGIAYNAAASTIENVLEADITAIDDVNVTGSGTPDDPYVITFITPCIFAGGLIFDGSALTPAPGDSALTRSQFGALMPNPWTKSQTVSDGTPVIHGDYTSFRVTTAEAHSGTYSLLIDPASIGRRFAGAQQIVNVKAGGTYQAAVWVKTNSASQEYRFVIRGIDEDLLLDTAGNPALVQQTLASGTWTLFSIPDVDVGDNTQVIVRIANINVSGNPAIFYVDDGVFAEGMAAATVGVMMGDLYADATTDHVGRVVWDDGNSGLYLTLDFSDTLDSAGAAWADPELSLTFRPRMSYLQVLGEFANLGYEWRVVPDATDGAWLLQIYNPGTLGGSVAAGLTQGAADIRRQARFFAPNYTDVVVQGQGQLSSRATNAGLESAFGRIEGSQLEMNITSTTDALLAASDAAAAENRQAESLVYTIRPYTGISRPLLAYKPGDLIMVDDPEIVQDERRVTSIEAVSDKTGDEYTVFLGSNSLVGQAAVNQAVYDILTKFERADDPLTGEGVDILGGGGGEITISISAAQSSGVSQGKTDYLWGTTINGESFETLLSSFGTKAGLVRFAEGRPNFDGHADVPDGWDFEGVSRLATRLEWSGAPDMTFHGINGLRHLSFRDNSS